MKYIIKNGKVYGIAVNDWNEITGIPMINNAQLQQGQNYSSADLNIMKQMTKAEYDALTTKNPECYYIVTTDTTINLPNINYLDVDNKPLINNVILTGNKSLRDLNLYSINEIDNMMASLRAIKVVATKPATADIIPNTLYYVGTSAPYHVYLYDSNKTEADLGDSNIDFSNFYTKTECDNKYLDKQNFLNNLYPKGTIYTTYENKNPSTFLGGTWVLIGGQDANLNYYPAFAISTDTAGTTISESAPNIKASYRPGGNWPITNLRTDLTNGNQTAVSGAFSIEQEELTLMISSISGDAVKPKVMNFDASKSNSIYKDNAHVNVNAIKIFFWRRTDDAPVIFNTGNITMNTKIDENATNNDIPTSKAVVDYARDNSAPLDSVKAYRSSGISLSPNQCIFDMEYVPNNTTIRITLSFPFVNVQITDPIADNYAYGEVITHQTVWGNNRLIVDQTFTAYAHATLDGGGMVTKNVIFKRKGYLEDVNGLDWRKITTDLASRITWKPWYPVEYPSFQITPYATHVSGGALYGSVTGGQLTVRGDGIRFVSGISTIAADICRIPGISINAVKYINSDNFQYSQLIAFNPSAMSTVNHLIGLVKRTEGSTFQLAIACWRGDVGYPTEANQATFFSVSCGLGY